MNNTSVLTITSDYVLGTPELVSVLVGLLLNPLTIPHFFHHRKQFTSLLYLLISVTDILILGSCFPTAVSMLNMKSAMLLKNRVLCMLSGFVFNIFSRMSVFLIAMLSVARALQLIFPFTIIRSAIYLVVMYIYLFLNISLAALPLMFSSKRYYYADFFAQCTWGINELSFVNSSSSSLWHAMTYTTIILPWLLPALIVVLSCIASVIVLLKSSYRRRQFRSNTKETRKHYELRLKSNGAASTEKSHEMDSFRSSQLEHKPAAESRSITNATAQATLTIVIMTLVYILFNVPCGVVYIYLLSKEFDPLTWMDFNPDLLQMVFILLGRTSVALNSAANPIVYLCRMKPLRARLRGSTLAKLIQQQMVKRGWYNETNFAKTNVANVFSS